MITSSTIKFSSVRSCAHNIPNHVKNVFWRFANGLGLRPSAETIFNNSEPDYALVFACALIV